MSRKYIFFTLLVLVVSVLTVGGGLYYLEQKKVAASKFETQVVKQTVNDPQGYTGKNEEHSISVDLLEIKEQLSRDRYKQEELELMIGELRLKQTQSEQQIEQRLNKINELKPLLEKSAEPGG